MRLKSCSCPAAGIRRRTPVFCAPAVWLRLLWLLAARCLRTGRGALVGVCGGLQLLGAEILDPLALEEGGREAGLNLLPLRTTLQAAKQLRRTTGTALAALTDGEADAAVTGYEIHHGSTEVVTRVARLPAAGEPTVLLRDAAGRGPGLGPVRRRGPRAGLGQLSARPV